MLAERRQRRGARPFSCTSVCVSSISKMRSDAAIACCRFALTRLSFFAGPYIRNSAAMNDVNSPVVRRPLAICSAAVPERGRHAEAAEQLHQRRQARKRGRHLHVGAEQLVAGPGELVGLVRLRRRTP